MFASFAFRYGRRVRPVVCALGVLVTVLLVGDSAWAQTPPPAATVFQNVRIFDGKSGRLSEASHGQAPDPYGRATRIVCSLLVANTVGDAAAAIEELPRNVVELVAEEARRQGRG